MKSEKQTRERRTDPFESMNSENYSMKVVGKHRKHLHRGTHWTNTRDLLTQSNYSAVTNSHELTRQPVIDRADLPPYEKLRCPSGVLTSHVEHACVHAPRSDIHLWLYRGGQQGKYNRKSSLTRPEYRVLYQMPWILQSQWQEEG